MSRRDKFSRRNGLRPDLHLGDVIVGNDARADRSGAVNVKVAAA